MACFCRATVAASFAASAAFMDGVVGRRSGPGGPPPPSPRVQGPQPLFRIIVNGEIEADIEAPALTLPRISVGQSAEVDIAGIGPLPGLVRAIAPEVDPATQLGHVRIGFKSDAA